MKGNEPKLDALMVKEILSRKTEFYMPYYVRSLTALMSNEEKAAFFDAILTYEIDSEMLPIPQRIEPAFNQIKTYLDDKRLNYIASSVSHSERAAKRYAKGKMKQEIASVMTSGKALQTAAIAEDMSRQEVNDVQKYIDALEAREASEEYEDTEVHMTSQDMTAPDSESVSVYDHILFLFNSICKSFPNIEMLTHARRSRIDALMESYTEEQIKAAFEKVERSDFLKGKSSKNGWKASFDWIIEEDNFVKILEDAYSNSMSKKASSLDWLNRSE